MYIVWELGDNMKHHNFSSDRGRINVIAVRAFATDDAVQMRNIRDQWKQQKRTEGMKWRDVNDSILVMELTASCIRDLLEIGKN